MPSKDRRSIRLPDYDYSRPGAYFVTFCVHQKECRLGEIENAVMNPNQFGEIAAAGWGWVEIGFPSVSVDIFCIMPNHVHTIIAIHENPRRGEVISPRGGKTPPLHDVPLPRPISLPTVEKPTLGQIMAYYKYATTTAINEILDNHGVKFWQRNYYERIIRSDKEYQAIGHYIQHNPANWLDDENYSG